MLLLGVCCMALPNLEHDFVPHSSRELQV
jgi:hypothetical protein